MHLGMFKGLDRTGLLIFEIAIFSHVQKDGVDYLTGSNKAVECLGPAGPAELISKQGGSLRPNSITLSASKLIRSWSQTGSNQFRTCLRLASNLLRTSFEPDSVMEFGFKGKVSQRQSPGEKSGAEANDLLQIILKRRILKESQTIF